MIVCGSGVEVIICFSGVYVIDCGVQVICCIDAGSCLTLQILIVY